MLLIYIIHQETSGNIIHVDNYENILNKTLKIDSPKSNLGISLFNKN